MDKIIDSRKKYKRKRREIKKQAAFTYKEIILIVLFGPIMILIFDDLFPFWKGYGYRKMNKQGVFFGIVGIALWATIGIFLLK